MMNTRSMLFSEDVYYFFAESSRALFVRLRS